MWKCRCQNNSTSSFIFELEKKSSAWMYIPKGRFKKMEFYNFCRGSEEKLWSCSSFHRTMIQSSVFLGSRAKEQEAKAKKSFCHNRRFRPQAFGSWSSRVPCYLPSIPSSTPEVRSLGPERDKSSPNQRARTLGKGHPQNIDKTQSGNHEVRTPNSSRVRLQNSILKRLILDSKSEPNVNPSSEIGGNIMSFLKSPKPYPRGPDPESLVPEFRSQSSRITLRLPSNLKPEVSTPKSF